MILKIFYFSVTIHQQRQHKMEIETIEIPANTQYQVNQNFIAIDVSQFVDEKNQPNMKCEDIKNINKKTNLKLIMHTMPGNDITCQASPFKQWQKAGSGLAVPYQKEQGEPATGLPNLWVSPIPSTFKNSENKSDIGKQRYLIKQYIRQLYYYAGLGFAIAVPVRPRSQGSEKENSWGNKPQAFEHTQNKNQDAVLLQFKNSLYEYAFGAGINPDFCKNHGAFLEKELNDLEIFINHMDSNKNQMDEGLHDITHTILDDSNQTDSNEYHAAYGEGNKSKHDFLECVNQHSNLISNIKNDTDQKSQSIDACHIFADYIDQTFMRFYTPPIPANAVIQDTVLRKEITVAILLLEKSLESLGMSLSEWTEKQDKQQKIKALQEFLSLSFDNNKEEEEGEDENDNKNEKKTNHTFNQVIESINNHRINIYNEAQKTIPKGKAFDSRTQKILDKIREQYPEEPRQPEKPTESSPFAWLYYFFSHLIYEHFEKPNFDAKKTAFETHQATNKNSKPIKASDNIQTIYLPLTVPKHYPPSFFQPSLFERVQTSLNEDNDLIKAGFYSKQAAILEAGKGTIGEDTVIIKATRNTANEITYCFIEPKTGRHSDGILAQNVIDTNLKNAFSEVENRKKTTIGNTELKKKPEDDENIRKIY